MFLEHSDLPGFSPSAHRQTNSLRTVCVLAFPSFVNMLTLHFASLLDVLFLQCGLQKYTFQVVSCRIERTISLSRLSKGFKLISLCNLHRQTKGLCWRLLDSRLFAKTAYYCSVTGREMLFHALIFAMWPNASQTNPKHLANNGCSFDQGLNTQPNLMSVCFPIIKNHSNQCTKQGQIL